MKILLGLLILYPIISIVVTLLYTFECKSIEDTFFSSIIKSKETNYFGKIILIIFILPFLIIEQIGNGIIFLCTWHPNKKK